MGNEDAVDSISFQNEHQAFETNSCNILKESKF